MQGIQQLLSTPAPGSATLNRTILPLTSQSATPVFHPSTGMQQQIQTVRNQSYSQAQLTSPQMLQAAQTQVQQQSPASLQAQHTATTSVLNQTNLGQQLKQMSQVGGRAIHIGAQIHDQVLEGQIGEVKPFEQIEEAMDAMSQPFEFGEREISTAESYLLETATGVTPETVATVKSVMDTGKKILQISRAVQSIADISNYQDTFDLGSKVMNASKDTFCALGGDSTIELGSKILDCCRKQDFDSTKEMMQALGKFVQDDSYVASAERSLIASAATSVLGSSTTQVLGKGLPFLSYGAAVVDVGLLAKTSYDWYQGNASTLDLIKSSITAVGSSAGATVAPFLGPLAATALNYSVDGIASLGNKVWSWWSGSPQTP